MSDMQRGEGVDLGAYGLRITGLARAAAWMQAVPAAASSLHVEVATQAAVERGASRLTSDEADLRLVGGGRLTMRRGEPLVCFRFTSSPAHDELLHPYLAPAAALVQLWAGREALHAGAFAGADGAVAVMGEKASGKSTTLAWLAREHGVPIYTDDLLVVEGQCLLAGPRCVDVRAGDELVWAHGDGTSVRGGDRLRLTLAPVADRAPLSAIVVLQWGARVNLTPAAPAQRPRWLLAQRMYADRVQGNPAALLDLCAAPMFILERPVGAEGLAEAASALARYFG